jgi:hypothetical protein
MITDDAVLRKLNLEKLRVFHQETFNKLNLKNPILIGKMAYKPKELNTKHCAFFYSELKNTEDIYLEFTNRFCEPETEDRSLYVLKHNPHFGEEYAKSEKGMFLVPIDELILVKKYNLNEVNNIQTVDSQSFIDFTLPDPKNDPAIGEMTIRDFAAIMLKAPISNKSWINDIIKQIK